MTTEIMSQLPSQYPGTEERGPEPPQPPAYGGALQPSQLPPPPTYSYDPAYDPALPGRRPPTAGRRGILGWLTAVGLFLLGYAKYAFLLVKAVPALLTLSTLFLSFGLYALYRGPVFAAALVAMIFVHETGHVGEILRHGTEATAPVFIPFLGAAFFQRSPPPDARRPAEMVTPSERSGPAGAPSRPRSPPRPRAVPLATPQPARACRPSDVRDLQPEGMGALMTEASAICGIPLAGTRKVFGR